MHFNLEFTPIFGMDLISLPHFQISLVLTSAIALCLALRYLWRIGRREYKIPDGEFVDDYHLRVSMFGSPSGNVSYRASCRASSRKRASNPGGGCSLAVLYLLSILRGGITDRESIGSWNGPKSMAAFSA
jgi:hypothetical protein